MIYKNIVCPVCGAACDDIQVEFGDGKIEAKNACKMGNAKFQEVVSSHRLRQPLMKTEGKLSPAAWDKALEKAADILVSAKRPLLFMTPMLQSATDQPLWESRNQEKSVQLKVRRKTGGI